MSNESDTGTFADFMEAFKTYDREGQGFINAAELRHVLCSLGLFLDSTFVMSSVLILLLTLNKNTVKRVSWSSIRNDPCLLPYF